MQTLNRTFMGHLKTYYSDEISQCLITSNRILTQYNIAELLVRAYLRCQTGAIAVNGLTVTGTNGNRMSDADYMTNSGETALKLLMLTSLYPR
ncbi:hypothetical protein GWI33_007306 [Rhynchophorus ferrugineus]|uniref:Uncharacterized protein n=1 Tax=Rhynchophorus ferrugineus TaxID=354439 RepID=A0A834IB97_RHYFE|nr:hypothetical protein GWI33_007306 [Rhynchophorus ferrugineus]